MFFVNSSTKLTFLIWCVSDVRRLHICVLRTGDVSEDDCYGCLRQGHLLGWLLEPPRLFHRASRVTYAIIQLSVSPYAIIVFFIYVHISYVVRTCCFCTSHKLTVFSRQTKFCLKVCLAQYTGNTFLTNIDLRLSPSPQPVILQTTSKPLLVNHPYFRINWVSVWLLFAVDWLWLLVRLNAET